MRVYKCKYCGNSINKWEKFCSGCGASVFDTIEEIDSAANKKSDEEYENYKKKIKLRSIIILVIGLAIGLSLIGIGVFKPFSGNIDKYKMELEVKKQELIDKGVVLKTTANYTDGEAYDLYIITNALDPSFSYCKFDEYKNNEITKNYCKAENSNSTSTTAPLIMIGVFISLATCMISFTVRATSSMGETLKYNMHGLKKATEDLDLDPSNVKDIVNKYMSDIDDKDDNK